MNDLNSNVTQTCYGFHRQPFLVHRFVVVKCTDFVLVGAISNQNFKAHLRDGILARTVDDIVEGSLPTHVVHANEFEKGGVYEAHADPVPHVHRGQV